MCRELPVDFVAEPEPALVEHYREQLARFRQLYANLRSSFDRETS